MRIVWRVTFEGTRDVWVLIKAILSRGVRRLMVMWRKKDGGREGKGRAVSIG